MSIRDLACGNQDSNLRAIAPENADLTRIQLPFCGNGLQYFFAFTGFCVKLCANVFYLSQHLLRGFIAVHLCVGTVHTQQAPIWQGLRNSRNRVFKQIPITPLGYPNGIFGQPAFRDVTGNAVNLPMVVVQVEMVMRCCLRPDCAAILAGLFHFVKVRPRMAQFGMLESFRQ